MTNLMMGLLGEVIDKPHDGIPGGSNRTNSVGIETVFCNALDMHMQLLLPIRTATLKSPCVK